MKMSPANERNSSLKKHQHEMKRLGETHKNELDKTKNVQNKQKQEMQLSHKIELSNIQAAHDSKLQGQLLKNEQVLEKARESLEKSKAVTSDEQRRIENNHLKRKNDLKELHSAKTNNASMKNQLQIEDMNQEARIEIQKLQRKIDKTKTQQAQNHNKESLTTDEMHKHKMNMTRDVYQMQQTREQDKFQNALLKQKKFNKDMLTNNERKHHKKVEGRKEHYGKEIGQIESDGNKKKIAKTKKFENDYKEINAKQEFMLRNLVGKKEKLIHELRADLTKEYKLGIEKNKDPFYSFGRIETKVTELADKSGYEVRIPASKHEAANVELRAEDRELRVTMHRNYHFEKNDTDSRDKISKVESFVSKIPVKNIIDPDTIDKSYKDGFVIYTIKNA